MYSSKGTTIYKDGVEVAYIRTYVGAPAEKYKFAALVADGLNNSALIQSLAQSLTDLVGLIKAPDKNQQFYASQVRSALLEADKALADKRLFDCNVELRKPDQQPEGEPLDADDVHLGALAFDASLAENGLAATLATPDLELALSTGKTEIVRERALVLGLDMVEIPLRGAIPLEPSPEDTHLDPAPTMRRSKWDTVIVLPNISVVQRDAIIAGLRLLQQHITGIDKWTTTDIVEEIAGDSGTVIAAEDIDGLCEAFNIG